jgi:hypothetical protein
MVKQKVSINRAPVLTLWAAIVAERLGFNRAEGLSLAKALAGLNAQSTGRRLGLFKPHEEKPKEARAKEANERFLIELLGRPVPARNADDGIRAVPGKQTIDPAGVERYLQDKFGDDLKAARTAMRKLARAYPPAELAHKAYGLYERFRPRIPEGVKGWGARGELDLGLIERLAKE